MPTAAADNCDFNESNVPKLSPMAWFKIAAMDFKILKSYVIAHNISSSEI